MENTLQRNATKVGTENKISGSCLGSSKKNDQTDMIVFIAADVEDNVTQQLSDPDSDNSNLICVAKFASELENTV